MDISGFHLGGRGRGGDSLWSSQEGSLEGKPGGILARFSKLV